MTPPRRPRTMFKRRKRRRPEPTPEERERLIREHLERKGVTKLPSAYSRVD